MRLLKFTLFFLLLPLGFCKLSAQEQVPLATQNGGGIYYGDNFVVFEAEATASSMAKWKLRKLGEADYQKYVTKSSGVEPVNDTYLEYTGPWKGGVDTELEYKFTCPKTAKYRLLMRMHQPLKEGEKGDAKNDVFVRLKGDYTSGINKPTSDLQNSHKFWGRGVNKWGSCHKVEIVSNMILSYNLKKGEEYIFTMSGRSTNTCIDYILFYEQSSFGEIPQGDDVATFFPANMRPGLGLVDPVDVAIVPDSANVRVGSTIQLSTVWEPTNSSKDLEWISSDEQVITVDANGLVTATGAVGQKATIIAKSTINSVADTCEVTIVEWFENPVKSLSVSPETNQIAEGSSVTLMAHILPIDADNLTVIWTSSDESVATVNQNGKVTALTAGTTIIRATSNANDTVYGESSVEVAALVSAFMAYDDENKYKTTEYISGSSMEISVDYHAGTFNAVTEAKLWLRHMNSSWKVVKDYVGVIPNGIVGTTTGTMKATIDTEGAIPTSQLPTGDFYFLFVKWTFSDGNTINKGINPINVFEAPSAVENVEAEQIVSIFPNPANETLTVKALNSNANFSTSLYNASGKLVYSSGLTNNTELVNSSDFISGIYFLQVSTDKGVRTHKIIIKH